MNTDATMDRPPTSRHAHPLQNRRTFVGLYRFSALKLLIALLLFIMSAPFVDVYRHGVLVGNMLLTTVLITAALTMGSQRWTLIVATCLMVPALFARFLHHLHPELIPIEIFSIISMLFIGFVVVNIVHFVLRAPEVNSDVLFAGISAYLLIGLLWAFAYTLVWALDRNSFCFDPRTFSTLTDTPLAHPEMQAFTSIYFSYATLSCSGYGDIVAATSPARMICMMESMTGTFYVAILIARLVALHSTRKQST